MKEEQKDQYAIVFNMEEEQLRLTLFQIIKGDSIQTALDKARVKPKRQKSPDQPSLFK